jgi:hypothetical protein
MVFAAAPNGEPVELLLPVSDPGLSEVSMQPGETLTGDVDLRNVIKDLGVFKKSDMFPLVFEGSGDGVWRSAVQRL